MNTGTACLRAEPILDGQGERLLLARPPGNVLDSEMIRSLSRAVKAAAGRAQLKVLVLEGEGAHFSFGASVEEHLADKVAAMLKRFHELFRVLVEASCPIVAVVRGQCLGGGLELAAFAHRVFASPDARLGQPEIRLGVFAPAGSLVLPRRLGQAAADRLLLSGEVVKADEALDLGLVDVVADDPRAAAEAWITGALLDKSAAALRLAVAAARHEMHAAFLAGIDELERLYLERLMRTHDANEGLVAFLAKRKPVWANR